MNNRGWRNRQFGWRYDAIGLVGDPCIYCGMPSNAYDHVPPLSVVASVPESDQVHWKYKKYPACRECNSILGASALFTLAERRKKLLDKYLWRLRRLLRIPVWDDEDMEEIGPTLASAILTAHKNAAIAKARMANLRGCGTAVTFAFGGWNRDHQNNN